MSGTDKAVEPIVSLLLASSLTCGAISASMVPTMVASRGGLSNSPLYVSFRAVLRAVTAHASKHVKTVFIVKAEIVAFV